MFKYIIFDLDGTLLNTLDDLKDSVNHVMSEHGFPERTLDEIRRFVGNGVPTLIKRSVPANTSPEELASCTDEMVVWYKAHAKIKTAPYDGILPLLKQLKAMNVKTAVVTNKEENAARLLCKEFFGDVFETVIGDNGICPLKPAPDNVFRAMKAIGAQKEETLYIGDSEVDMATAKNSGVKSAGVLWGFRDRETLEKGGADFIVSSPNKIAEISEGK